MGSFGSLCLLSHCASLTEINGTHSIPLTFNHVSPSSLVPHQPAPTDSLQGWVKVTRPLQPMHYGAECPRAKRSHPVRGAVMTGRWCLCSKFACLTLSSNFFLSDNIDSLESLRALWWGHTLWQLMKFLNQLWAHNSNNSAKSNTMAPLRGWNSIYGV